MTPIRALLAAAAVLVLAGCSEPDATTSAASPSPSPRVTATSFGTATQLLAALETADLACTAPVAGPSDEQTAIEDVRCTHDGQEIVVSTYASRDALDDQIAFHKEVGDMIGYDLAYGPEWWLVNAADLPEYADEVAKALSGTAIHATSG